MEASIFVIISPANEKIVSEYLIENRYAYVWCVVYCVCFVVFHFFDVEC